MYASWQPHLCRRGRRRCCSVVVVSRLRDAGRTIKSANCVCVRACTSLRACVRELTGSRGGVCVQHIFVKESCADATRGMRRILHCIHVYPSLSTTSRPSPLHSRRICAKEFHHSPVRLAYFMRRLVCVRWWFSSMRAYSYYMRESSEKTSN